MNPPNIMLIGDDPNILRTLRKNLSGRGYDVSIALDDTEVLSAVRRQTYDLFILNLDFISIDIDGLSICAELRKAYLTPIIILSVTGSESQKVRALDLGADDYIVMPFNMEEFLARIRSALRRWAAFKKGPVDQSGLTLVGDLLIDEVSRMVSLNGDPVRLTPTEYDILTYLAKRSGKVVTHRELLRSIWGAEYGNEREYLRVFVSQLRRKIEPDPMRPTYILTESGVGYRFATNI